MSFRVVASALVLYAALPSSAFAGPDPAVDSPAPSRVLTLASALRTALEQGGLVASARAGTEALEAKLTQAESVQWPHGNFSFVIAPTPAQRGNALAGRTDYGDWGYFLQAEVTGWLPLYTFGKISHLKKAARLGVDVGRALEEVARAETRFRILKAWFGLCLARELDSIVSEGRGYIEKAEKHLKEQEESDDPTFDPVDKMKLKVSKAQILGKELEARRTRDLAAAALRLTIGMDPASDVDVVTVEPTVIEPLGDTTRAGLVDYAVSEGRPEIKALKRGLEARRAEVALRTAQFWPDLGVVGFFKIADSNVADGQQTPFANDPFNTFSGGGGLALKYDFEIAKKIGELRESRANLAKLGADAAEADRGVRLEVGKLHQEMTDARRMVDAQNEAMKAARGWVIAKLDLYENDMGNMNDVLTALVQFFQSRMDYLKAIYDFNVSVAALERATGRVLVPVGE